MNRQGSVGVPPREDSLPVQAYLIRDMIREELRRGLGRCSRCSEGRAACPPLRRILVQLGVLVLHLRLAPPTCQEVALALAPPTLS